MEEIKIYIIKVIGLVEEWKKIKTFILLNEANNPAAAQPSNQSFFSFGSLEWAEWRKMVDGGLCGPSQTAIEWRMNEIADCLVRQQKREGCLRCFGLVDLLWVRGGVASALLRNKKDKPKQAKQPVN